MKTYHTPGNEETVAIRDASPVYKTYTRGTCDPLYVGDDEQVARESLNMTEAAWNGLLMSDADED